VLRRQLRVRQRMQVRQRVRRVSLHWTALPFRSIPLRSSLGIRSLTLCPSVCRCKMYPDMAEQVTTTTQTLIMGVAPSKGGFEAAAGAENGGCK
jgi:hypothetical protein